MQATLTSTYLSVEDYLAGERASEVRHEYLAGTAHAMAGASEEHNTLSLNLAALLRQHLRGKPCRVFMVDMKVRIHVAHDDIFYYPDLLVTCDPRDSERYFKQLPKVIVEVLSPETERVDRREKFLSYTQLTSLDEYVLVAQDKLEVIVFRRTSSWKAEILRQPNESLRLESVGFAAPLALIYEGVFPQAS